MQASTTSQRMRLFGRPTYVTADGKELPFSAERRFQLLAHLACRRQWLAREELAEMFWPERDRGSARSNLRKVLLLAQQLPGLPPLERQGDLLRWMPPSDLSLFEAAVIEARHADALDLYHPPLMQDMDAGLGAGAAEWLDFERQRVAGLWRSTAAAQLEALDADPEAAMALAQRLLLLDPDDEAALIALGEACGALGRPAQGLAALQRHAQRLAEDDGLELSGPLRRLADELRAAKPGAASPSAPRTWPRSAPATTSSSAALVGRRTEVAQIRRLLGQDNCRLLTLTGPPGVGKSTLARGAMVALAEGDAQRARWVPLEDLTEESQVAVRLASVLAIELGGDAPAWLQIEAALATRDLLLVLDNAEHLPLAQPLTSLLDACPSLRLLVTSRARLRAAGEWLLPIDGLPLPDDDETDPEVLRHCDAVQLFELRALQRSPTFELARMAGDVVRLLHVVEGLPLAIELAAAWTHVLPVSEIIAELARSLDLLEPDAGASHERGLRASFAQSWRLLTPAERAGLARLALLPGAFDRDMAQQVAAASLPVLAALVDKSLLRSEPGGRFSLHSLLRQCAAAHASDSPQVAERHARHVAQRFLRYGEMSQMPLAEVEAELPHLRAAWRWALAQRDATAMIHLAGAFDVFCQQRGTWMEGMAAFEAAVAAFDGVDGNHDRPLQVALRTLTNMRFFAGDLGSAETSARRSLKLARQLGDRQALKIGLNALASILCQRGEFSHARTLFEQSMRIAERDGDLRRVAIVVGNLAVVYEGLGDYERALATSRQAMAMQREAGRLSGLAICLSNLGNLLRLLQRRDEALPVLHESLALCDAHGLSVTKAVVLSTLGMTHADLGDGNAAATWLHRALDEARRHGEPGVAASTLLAQARLSARAGDNKLARRQVGEALDIGARLRSSKVQVECVIGFGDILVHDGCRATGAALLQWGVARPDMYRSNADAAQRRLDALRLDAHTLQQGRALLPASASLDEALSFAARHGAKSQGA